MNGFVCCTFTECLRTRDWHTGVQHYEENEAGLWARESRGLE